MRRLILFCSIFASILIANSSGQDIGDPDSCRFSPSSPIWTVASEADSLFTVELWAFSDDPMVSEMSLGFKLSTSTGSGGGRDDSLLIIEDFAVNASGLSPGVSFSVGISYLDESFGGLGWGYNGFSIGLVAFGTSVLLDPAPTRLGDLTVRLLSPEDMPCEFDIVIDSTFFPPAGTFNFSPAGGTGYSPQFSGCVIHVTRRCRTLYHVDTLGSDSLGDGSMGNPYRTVQHAIDQTDDGDTVVIHDGEYLERITYDGKAITVGSKYILDVDLTHIENTIINGDTLHTPLVSDTGSVVRFVNGEDSTSVLCGVTVTGGIGTEGNGGGVFAVSSSPTISRCAVRDNAATVRGGGIYGYDCSGMLIENCRLSQNTSSWGGGASIRGNIRVSGCRVDSNEAESWGGLAFDQVACSLEADTISNNVGGGVRLFFLEHSTISGCVIKHNSGRGISGGYYKKKGDKLIRAGTFTNCEIDSNSDLGMYLAESAYSLIGCSISGNGAGGILLQADTRLTMSDCSLIANTGSHACIRQMDNAGILPHEITGSSFIDNSGSSAGAIYGGGDWSFENCSFISNSSTNASSIYIKSIEGTSSIELSNCIIAYGSGTQPVICEDPPDTYLTIRNSDIYGNEGGDWVGCIADQLDDTCNISLDPLFCDTAAGDFTIMDVSPCAPENNDCNTLIGAHGIGCSGTPSVVEIGLLDEPDILHVLNHTPEIYWLFDDPVDGIQESFEIEVGTDDNWDTAEKWDPEPFESSDTSIVYAGDPLVDGETIWLRLRTNNGYAWSEWDTESFRLNSVPNVPILLSPVSDAVVESIPPGLTIENSSDPENDTVGYILQLSTDAFSSVFCADTTAGEAGDSTIFTPSCELIEDSRYWWRVRALDGFEESPFSVSASFYVNTANSAPGTFGLVSPADLLLDTLEVEFTWFRSSDTDPLDSILYNLYVSVDSGSVYAEWASGIVDTFYLSSGELEWGRDYVWKVRVTDLGGDSAWSNDSLLFRTALIGDVNCSRAIDVDDVVYLISYVFQGGPPPDPEITGDVTCDGSINIDDIVALIDFTFNGGPGPCTELPLATPDSRGRGHFAPQVGQPGRSTTD